MMALEGLNPDFFVFSFKVFYNSERLSYLLKIKVLKIKFSGIDKTNLNVLSPSVVRIED